MPVAFSDLFDTPAPVIAMIHTGPSPGVPGCVCVESAIRRAVAEADVYLNAGVDGILVENMHDFPCVHERNMGPEVGAFMTRIAHAVKCKVRDMPVGLQILFQANKTALAVAVAAGCDFIRAEGWTYAHISDKGIAEASAAEVIRYRRMIGAEHIPVFADVKKKHAAHAWTGDVGIAEVARSMDLHRANAVIVTGTHTGEAVNLDDLNTVNRATDLPVLIGSGITTENLGDFAMVADGFIVGSALKEGGVWHAPVSEERVEAMVAAAERVRTAHHVRLMRN